jgi:Flp pilus assembly protein TadB
MTSIAVIVILAWVGVFVALAAVSVWLRRKRRGRRKEDRMDAPKAE